MRRFRLLKDLPGIDAGTILCLDDVSDELFIQRDTEHINFTGLLLYQDGSFGIRGGHVVFSASDWLEELSNEYKRWRANANKPYYYLGPFGDIIDDVEQETYGDEWRHAVGNYFATEAKAQTAADYLKALAIVRDDAKGFVPDWGDSEQKRFTVYFDIAMHRLCGALLMTCYIDNGVFGLPYFATKEDAEASIEKHRKEWLTIFGIKDETECDDE